jgi:DnaJ family protein B protein 13
LNQNEQTTTQFDKILTIEINQGWKDGTKLTFEGEGDQGPNQLPGDIVFIVRQSKHERFERSGNDLIYTSRIPLLDALTGTSLDILTLDERQLKVPINETVR